MKIIAKIEPQPPRGIKYMLGAEPWLPLEKQTHRRLHCEEWGNLGPAELDPEIKPNAAGLRVRSFEFFPPEGARGFELIDGIYYWIDLDCFERMDEQLASQTSGQ